ncbi:SMI1/KNR4 family protein [Streptomyces sp. NPDC049597]|uniref:SMI1/KNR4 family protein n=1 Tax=Streptomyces sp. NPDC049597 TaxID=3155276 RepID=UPI00342A07F2
MDYLANALALAGAHAERSDTAVARLNALEAEHGRSLPATVRTWYSLSAATTILEPESNGDFVYPVERLGEPETYYWPTDDEWPEGVEEQEEREFDPVAHDLLPFLNENQGVYCLAVRLDGSDDPPVLLSWDGVLPDSWLPHAESFSQWVYTRVWDFAPLRSAGALEATAQEITEADLDALGQLLEARPVTAATRQSRRFAGHDDDQRLLLIPPFAAGCGWSVYFWAPTEDLLVDLVTTVRSVLSIGDVSTPSFRPDDTVKRALARLSV